MSEKLDYGGDLITGHLVNGNIRLTDFQESENRMSIYQTAIGLADRH